MTAANYIKASGTGPTPVVVAGFTANTTAGSAPLAVAFTDLSTGLPTSWNWSFGDGTFAEEQNPVHTYTAAGNYSVTLVVLNAGSSDSYTIADDIVVQSFGPAFDARVEFSAIPLTMLQGEHYLVDIQINNTGSRSWSGDLTSPDYVYLQGWGGSGSDAAKFNLTHIPMLFENESVAPGESYDFFFFMQAPDSIGNYTPEYQVVSAGHGAFGEISNNSVSVIENPFHPVVQPDGTKLYTTSFGNTSAGVRIDIVGPKVYLDDVEVLIDQDPQYLINPTLKSNIIDIRMNESFTYANITLDYDPAKESNPANLSLGYYNRTTGNYTFVPTTIDTTKHQVTAQVTHFSDWGAINGVSFYLLPAYAQTKTGYLKVEKDTVWSINPDVQSFSTTHFANAALLPPGNYTILASGSYSNTYTDLGIYQGCFAGWSTADSNPDTWSGMQLNFNNPDGASEVTVSSKRVSSGILGINHNGGLIGVRNKHYVNPVCGSGMNYKMNYTGDKALYPPGMAFLYKLQDDHLSFWKNTDPLYKMRMGCVLGAAGTKGSYLQNNFASLPNAGYFLGEDITSSFEYSVGQGLCYAEGGWVIAGPRDMYSTASTGDTFGTVIYGFCTIVGGGGAKFAKLIEGTPIEEFVISQSGKIGGSEAGKQVITILKKADILKYLDDYNWKVTINRAYSLSPRNQEIVDEYLAQGLSRESIEEILISPRGPLSWVDENAVSFNKLSGNKNWYNPDTGTTVIGKYIENDPYSYEVFGKLKKSNYYDFIKGTAPGDANANFMKLAYRNSDDIICTSDPELASGAYLDEVMYLYNKGYQVVGHSYETVGGRTYELWRMAKV